MSTNAHKNAEDQEIDLSLLSKKIGGFFQNLNTSIFNAIQFVINHIIVIGILFIIGVGIGLYLDDSQKTYDHQIIVMPNFGSTDYLYSKVELLNSKIKENDTIFLQKIGIKGPKKISKIEIKPIIDVYRFIENKEQNFDMLKLFAEDGDLKKIVEENTTSKNYTYHLISYTTKGLSSSEQTLNPLMAFFNDSDYFKIIQKEIVNNTMIKMQANDITISQIDAILNQSSNSGSEKGKGEKLVFYNGDSQLDDVVKTKDEMQRQQGYFRISLINYTKIIKDISFTLNKKNTQAVNGNMKLILPLLFIFFYIIIYLFRGFYRKQKALALQK